MSIYGHPGVHLIIGRLTSKASDGNSNFKLITCTLFIQFTNNAPGTMDLFV